MVRKKVFLLLKILAVVFVVVILFVSPLTKYLVEKYDVRYTGREITMDWAYVNLFTGYVYFDSVKIFEAKGDSVFLSSEGISANFGMLKLLSSNYDISDLTLDAPRVIFSQPDSILNLDDLIKTFSPERDSTIFKEPTHLSINNIKIKNGEFHYREEEIPINYFIKSVNLESSGIHRNADTIAAKFSFLSGIGNGDMQGDFVINSKNLDYRFVAIVNKFDLNIIEQYLNDITNYGTFKASLDADIKAKGNFNDSENISASGQLAITDFHFGKSPNEDYASFKQFSIGIDELSPKNHQYLFDSVALSSPFFEYERYDYLDNLQTMFGEDGANISSAGASSSEFNLVIEIANYIEILAKNFFQSDYKINHLSVSDGDLKFNDYSYSEKFTMDLNPIEVAADSIDKNHNRVQVLFKSGIKPYGNASVELSINPKDSGYFDLTYHFQKIPVSLFNPYIISLSSYPLDRGTIELNGTWNVNGGNIQSVNHVVIIDPRLTDKVRNKGTERLPLPLIMAVVRERGNVIDYEIPISGNLKDPKFHLRDAVFDLVENIFVKPATTPYRLKVKTVETEIEKSLSLKWGMRQSTLEPQQERFLREMADFLKKTPSALITINPQYYEIKEKEMILFFEAKKKFYLTTNKGSGKTFNEADSVRVSKMSVKDSLFVRYLNKQISDSLIFTIQGKCAQLIDSKAVETKFQQLNDERERLFMSYFKDESAEKQVKFSAAKSTIPYSGFSFYKMEYKGELPNDLARAYEKMNELDNKEPRKKFKKERKSNGDRVE
ncbi:MAG: DUF748 domain-containing protein [Flavobacteriales bacterium]